MPDPSAALRVLVLSDTHLERGRRRRLPDLVYAELEQCDRILHAGDVLEAHVLDELRAFAPVHAVLGNNDHSLLGVLPEREEVDLGGVRVAMVHDSGSQAGRPERMRRWFPVADLVVYGHSHVPFDGEGRDGQRLFNPGSPTERRAQPQASFGKLVLGEGRIQLHEIVFISH